MSNENHTTVSASDLESTAPDAVAGEQATSQKDTRVSIHVHSVRKRLTDADGVSAKAVIDGIVLAGILPDDSPAYVKEVTYSQEKGDPEETIIEIK